MWRAVDHVHDVLEAIHGSPEWSHRAIEFASP
jgi:hypothetical protein